MTEPSPPAPIEIPERFNLADWLLDERLREGRGGDVALRLPDRDLTYDAVAALSRRYANVLSGLGLRPEERVFLMLPDGSDFVGALFGTLRAGGVVVMLNPELHADAIAALVDYLRPRFAVIDGRLAHTWADSARDQPGTHTAPHGRRPRPRLPGVRRALPHRRRRLPHRLDSPRRSGGDALLRRHHRPPQGGRAEPPLVRLHHPGLRTADSRPHRGRHHARRSEALLRLCDGVEPLLPFLRRRLRLPVSRRRRPPTASSRRSPAIARPCSSPSRR